MDYNEDSDATTEDQATTRNRPAASEPEEELDEEEEPTVSVSSRGRVRKIIAKARRIFRD